MTKYLGTIEHNARCFSCLRPDHVDVYDEHVARVDYDALAARLAEAERLLGEAYDGLRHPNTVPLEMEISDFLRATDSATACLGGAPHWWDINANTGLPECRLCHKSPDPSAKESL